MARQHYFSGVKYESEVGYSRCIRIGNQIWVAGTTALQEEVVQHPENMYAQSVFILDRIRNVLQEAGARLDDVVRTRIYVTDITQAEEVGKAHGLFFRDIQPVTTMVEVSALVHPDMLVEIEAEAVVDVGA